jgi:hypothetical protein
MEAFTAFCNESVALSSAIDVVSVWPSGAYCFGSAFGGMIVLQKSSEEETVQSALLFL